MNDPSLAYSFWNVALLSIAFLSTVIGMPVYRWFALRQGIVASPNFRSLHQRPIPRGGGIVFALSGIGGVVALWLAASIDPGLARTLAVGGTVAAAFGFADDAMQMQAVVKLLVQFGLATWVLGLHGQPLCDLPLMPAVVNMAVSWIGLVWLMNLYNFIDGIDGLAASGAVMICAISIVVLLVTRGDSSLLLVFGLIAACSAGFLLFNWPPASIFMGDAGSMFLGFCFSALMADTVSNRQIGLWAWLVMFGYFAGDTTTTTIVRMFVTKKWYGEHRSHAYQNLARIGGHVKVVRGVVLYHVVWLLPLAVWSARSPSLAPVAAGLALTPVVVWTLRYGPRLSSS